jgi:aminocarboxymuconate-semialdehyde decarboxylase
VTERRPNADRTPTVDPTVPQPRPSRAGHPRPDPASRTPATTDIHTHLIPPGWEDWATKFGGERWPRLVEHDACRATIMTGEQFFRDVDDRSWNAARRIEDMDRMGVELQALSPPPVMFCYWADARATEAFARMQNENVAKVVARHPRRFVGMATVPLQDPALAVKELRHCREQLGLRAVEIGSCPGGRDFDDAELFPFFEACAELDVAVFVHPAAPLVGQERLTKYYFPLIVGNPLETALAASKLIYGGVLERLPRLRVCFAHGGGAFPFTLARLDHGWKGTARRAGRHPAASARVRAAPLLRLADPQRGQPPIPGRAVRRRPRGDRQRLSVRHGQRRSGRRRRPGRTAGGGPRADRARRHRLALPRPLSP